MLDKTLIRASHTFKNAHDLAGFINMKRAPFFLHFTHLLEAASAGLSFKAWNQHSVTSCYSCPSHSDKQMQQRKCRVRERFFPSISVLVMWASQSALSCFVFHAQMCTPLKAFQVLSAMNHVIQILRASTEANRPSAAKWGQVLGIMFNCNCLFPNGMTDPRLQ